MALKVLNNSIRPNRLVLTLLVFKAYPWIIKTNALLLIVAQRAVVLRKAMKEIRKLRALRQISDALNMRNEPRIDTVYNLLFNLKVLI